MVWHPLFAVVAVVVVAVLTDGVDANSVDRPRRQRCPPVCEMFCIYGNVMDEHGCPTCQCNKPNHIDVNKAVDFQMCGPVCAIYCEFGNVMDSRGCPTCQCNSGFNHVDVGTVVKQPVISQEQEHQRRQISFCGPVCAIFCEFGNVMDSDGCPTCQCNGPSHIGNVVKQPVVSQERERRQFCGPVCAIFCEFGNVMDSHGCPTCQCNGPSHIGNVVKQPVVSQEQESQRKAVDFQMCGPVCAIYCEFGNVMDSRGCPTCQCNGPSHIGDAHVVRR